MAHRGARDKAAKIYNSRGFILAVFRSLQWATIAAWILWAIYSLSMLGGILDKWALFASKVRALPMRDLFTVGWLLAPVRFGWLPILGLIFAVAMRNIGCGPRRMLGLKDLYESERWSIDILLGFALVSTLYFGLALAGLFYPALLASALALALPAVLSRPLSVSGFERKMPRPTLSWLLFIPALIALIAMLAPDFHVDTYIYHLAIPRLFLDEHKFVTEGLSMDVHYPLSAELLYTLGVMIGSDAFPHFIQLVPFMAAVAIIANWVRQRSGPAAAFLLVALVFNMGEVGRNLVVAKNVLVAAAFPAAGVICMLRAMERTRIDWALLAAIFMAFGAATKFGGYVLLPLAWMFSVIAVLPKGGRRFLSVNIIWAAMSGLAFGPWLIKTWLYMGDPMWPFLAKWMPFALWDSESQMALELMRMSGGLFRDLAAVGGEWLREWVTDQPLLALIFPICAVNLRKLSGSLRSLFAFSAAGYILIGLAKPGAASGLGLSMIIIWAAGNCMILGGYLNRAIRIGPILSGLGAVLLWLPAAKMLTSNIDPANLARYLSGVMSQRQFACAALTTYAQSAESTAYLGKRQRVMVLGDDFRFYRRPGRSMTGRFYGRNWAWVLAKECGDENDIRKRFRQMGCRYVSYNFVVESFPHIYYAPFRWKGREIRLWQRFVGKQLEIIRAPRRMDHKNGGFCLYRLRETPLREEPGFIPYLPGFSAAYYWLATNADNSHNYLTASRELYDRFPRVDVIRNRYAMANFIQSNYRKAYELFMEGIRHGTIDDMNYANAGVAAAHLGMFREAEKLLSISRQIYPQETASIAAELEKVRRLRRAQDRPQR